MIFPHLSSWTSTSVALHNAGLGAFPSPPRWEATLRAALGDLLQRPAGHRITVTAKHRLEATRVPTSTVFETESITVGRDPKCELVLPEAAIPRFHARLHFKQGQLYVEDLGSSIGTQIGERRLTPNKLEPIQAGDGLVVFPYSIECRVEQLWEPDPRFHLAPVVSDRWMWGHVDTSGLIGCAARVQPGGECIWLGVGQRVIEAAMCAVFGTEQLDLAGLLETDAGCLDFILTACLERCNAEFAWPLRLEWLRWGVPPPLANSTRGVLLETAVLLRGVGGTVRLFIPEPVVAELPRQAAPPESPAFAGVPLPCTWQLAELALGSSEAASLDEGDVVLIEPAPLLRIDRASLGWKCVGAGDNFSAFRFDKPLERIASLSTDLEFTEVPVSLQVILARKEYTLGELRALAPGAVIDLERDDAAPVQLAVNGKILGDGELVRIDNRLGVKVLGWRA